MRISILSLGLLGAATLFGQYGGWQDRCFNNPAAPYCQGHDYAIKPTPAPKDTAPAATARTPGLAPRTKSIAPTVVVVGGIDWRFADPFADAIAGFNFGSLAASPLAHSLVAQLGAKQNLSEAGAQKIFDSLSGVDQIAVSVHDKKFVVMLTGSVTENTLPAHEAGMKSVPISGTAVLYGSSDAVDQAARRIAMKAPLSELARSFEQRQSASEFWATGSARIGGPQAVSAGLKRFWLAVSIQNRVTSDLAFEFNGPPSAKTLQMLTLPGATVEGNVVHARMSMEAGEVQQKFGEVLASPMGTQLAALVGAAQSLPARDTAVPKQNRPVIYGLDEEPRVVKAQQ